MSVVLIGYYITFHIAPRSAENSENTLGSLTEMPYGKLSRGIYVLVVRVFNDAVVRVGRLGNIQLKAGYYLYVGSGQINVEKRVSRYFSKIKNPRWHIDYILVNGIALAEKAIILNLSKRYECKISRFIESMGGEAINDFGSSDCNCRSHFYRYADPAVALSRILEVYNHLLKVFPDDSIKAQ